MLLYTKINLGVEKMDKKNNEGKSTGKNTENKSKRFYKTEIRRKNIAGLALKTEKTKFARCCCRLQVKYTLRQAEFGGGRLSNKKIGNALKENPMRTIDENPMNKSNSATSNDKIHAANLYTPAQAASKEGKTTRTTKSNGNSVKESRKN